MNGLQVKPLLLRSSSSDSKQSSYSKSDQPPLYVVRELADIYSFLGENIGAHWRTDV